MVEPREPWRTGPAAPLRTVLQGTARQPRRRAGSDTPRRWSPERGRKPWQQGVACDGAPTVTAPHGRQPAGRPQVLVRLLGPGGPDLRAFYLPGLEGLKAQLRMLEWLMERAMRPLKEHLEARACSGQGRKGRRRRTARRGRTPSARRGCGLLADAAGVRRYVSWGLRGGQ